MILSFFKLAFLPLTLLLTIGDHLPERYVNAFIYIFDENPITTAQKQRGTLESGAERAGDLTLLRSPGLYQSSR